MRSTRLLALLSVAILAPIGALSHADAAHAVPAVGGDFSVLTYNVAGLPEPLSSGSPATNTPLIGERINAYDIVNVQEDFNYHAALYKPDMHPYRTPTSGVAGFGDGLNTLSDVPFSQFQRVKWSKCNGTDCLTPKGFSLARMRLTEGGYLDLYNVHTNAGTETADLAARRANITQLSQFITANSSGNAVIVMGDTNTRYTRAEDNIRELVTANGLTDVWVEKVRGGQPPAAGSPALVCDPANVTNECEVVDKILYRSSPLVSLQATAYNDEHRNFLDSAGKPLSDHYPHLARFSWQLAADRRASDLAGGAGGAPFSDIAALGGSPVVRELSLRGGSRLDQVGVRLDGGATLAHGGSGGTAQTLTLGAGEYLTEVTLSWGTYNGSTRVFSAQFRTSQGRSLSAGLATADVVTFRAPDGWQIAGFHGRSGSAVDMLGVLYTPRVAS